MNTQQQPTPESNGNTVTEEEHKRALEREQGEMERAMKGFMQERVLLLSVQLERTQQRVAELEALLIAPRTSPGAAS